jgi:hypothetical protein
MNNKEGEQIVSQSRRRQAAFDKYKEYCGEEAVASYAWLLVLQWWRAVDCTRIGLQSSGNDSATPFGPLFFVSLHNLVRAVEFSALSAQPEVMRSLDDFKRLVPDYKHFRNTVEHFDDYLIGTGAAQRHPWDHDFENIFQLTMSHSESGTWRFGIVRSGRRLTIDIPIAVEAAHQLVNAVYKSLLPFSRWGEYSPDVPLTPPLLPPPAKLRKATQSNDDGGDAV